MIQTDNERSCSLARQSCRADEAEPLYRRALAIDEKSFGPEHPNVAIRLHNLAGLLSAINLLAAAEPLFRQVLRILAEFSTRSTIWMPASLGYRRGRQARESREFLTPSGECKTTRRPLQAQRLHAMVGFCGGSPRRAPEDDPAGSQPLGHMLFSTQRLGDYPGSRAPSLSEG
jgi:hypothetical protein